MQKRPAPSGLLQLGQTAPRVAGLPHAAQKRPPAGSGAPQPAQRFAAAAGAAYAGCVAGAVGAV